MQRLRKMTQPVRPSCYGLYRLNLGSNRRVNFAAVGVLGSSSPAVVLYLSRLDRGFCNELSIFGISEYITSLNPTWVWYDREIFWNSPHFILLLKPSLEHNPFLSAASCTHMFRPLCCSLCNCILFLSHRSRSQHETEPSDIKWVILVFNCVNNKADYENNYHFMHFSVFYWMWNLAWYLLVFVYGMTYTYVCTLNQIYKLQI